MTPEQISPARYRSAGFPCRTGCCGLAAADDGLDPLLSGDDVHYEVTSSTSTGVRASKPTGSTRAAGAAPVTAQAGQHPTASQKADEPATDIAWFAEHVIHPALRGWAPELARAERAARHGGYQVTWVRPWVCQLLPPVGEQLITDSGYVHLDGTPDTDPYARLIEAQLTATTRLADRAQPHDLTSAAQNRAAGFRIEWEQSWVCLLYAPGGTALAAWGDGRILDGTPDTDPHARVFAAELALDAGLADSSGGGG